MPSPMHIVVRGSIACLVIAALAGCGDDEEVVQPPGSADVPDCVDYRGFMHQEAEFDIEELGVDQSPYDIVLRDSYAYILTAGTRSSRLLVADASDLRALTRITDIELESTATCLTIDGELAYIGGAQCTYIVDLATPTAPVVLGSLTFASWNIAAIAVHGDYAYLLAERLRTLLTVDVRDPTAPAIVDTVRCIDEGRDAEIYDGKLHLGGGEGLEVYDLADPAAPRKLLHLAVSFIFDLEFANGLLHVTSNPGYKILAPHDGYQPVSVLGLPDTPYLLAIDRGQFAYVALSSGALGVIDLRDISAPRMIGAVQGRGATALAFSGLDVVVTAKGRWVSEPGWVVVFDLANRRTPQAVGRLETDDDAHATACVEGLGFLVTDGGVVAIDLADARAPRPLGLSLPQSGRDVVSHGGRLYVSTYSRLFRVNPSNPAELTIEGMTDEIYPRAMAVNDSLCVVTGTSPGLHVLRWDDPEHPDMLAQTSLLWGDAVLLHDEVAICANLDGLNLFDLSDPTAPERLGIVSAADLIDMAIDGDLLVAVSDEGALHTFDISDARSPVELGECEVLGPPTGVALRDGIAYVSASLAGVQIVDVGDPTSPRWIGTIDTPDLAEHVTLSDEHALVACGDAGLTIVPLHCTE